MQSGNSGNELMLVAWHRRNNTPNPNFGQKLTFDNPLHFLQINPANTLQKA
jgi:hypothetical protein